MIARFKEQMVAPLRAGTKIHTVREGERWRVGLGIDFYGKVRTPQQYRIRPSTPLVALQQAQLEPGAMHLDGRRLGAAELRLFARQDGFNSPEEMFAFFEESRRRQRPRRGWPLRGQLLHWTPFRYLAPGEPATPARVADYLARLVQASQPEPLAGVMDLLLAGARCGLPASQPVTVASVAATLASARLEEQLQASPVTAILVPLVPLTRAVLQTLG